MVGGQGSEDTRTEESIVRVALAPLGDGSQTLAGEPWRVALAPSRAKAAMQGLRRALFRQNYTEAAAKALLGPSRLAAQGAWPRLSVPLEEARLQFVTSHLLSPTTLALLGTFLLNVSVPQATLESALGTGESGAALALELEDLGILWMPLSSRQARDQDANRWRSAVQIAPVSAGIGSTNALFFVVDWDELRPWHQVMTTTIDSYALLQAQKLAHPIQQPRRILDLCSGSGVQGLHAAALAASKGLHASVSLVDLNPRALRFAKANVMLNGLRRVTLQHGSLYDALPRQCVEVACNSTAALFDLVLANPPYVPSMGGGQLFVAGGATGEVITEAILRGASSVIKPGGWLMLVANLVNTHGGFLWRLPHEVA